MKILFTTIFVLTLVFSIHGLTTKKNRNMLRTTLITPSQANKDALGEAAYYAVLASSTTTNAGVTTVVGSIGVYPGTAIAGDAIILKSGDLHAADPYSLAAQESLLTAYNKLKDLLLPTPEIMIEVDLAGKILLPGVYKFNGEAHLDLGATLTLDANHDVNAIWVFQIASALITSLNSKVIMINEGDPLNVYWQIGSSATIFKSTEMVGNLVAYTAISFGDGATLRGRALAKNAAVTMISNSIDASPYI